MHWYNSIANGNDFGQKKILVKKGHNYKTIACWVLPLASQFHHATISKFSKFCYDVLHDDKADDPVIIIACLLQNRWAKTRNKLNVLNFIKIFRIIVYKIAVHKQMRWVNRNKELCQCQHYQWLQMLSIHVKAMLLAIHVIAYNSCKNFQFL